MISNEFISGRKYKPAKAYAVRVGDDDGGAIAWEMFKWLAPKREQLGSCESCVVVQNGVTVELGGGGKMAKDGKI